MGIGILAFVVAGITLVLVVLVTNKHHVRPLATARVIQVTAEGGSLLSVRFQFEYTGIFESSLSCLMVTRVQDHLRHFVKTETSEIETSGALDTGAVQDQYRNISVTAGDAAYTTAKDVTITKCVIQKSRYRSP